MADHATAVAAEPAADSHGPPPKPSDKNAPLRDADLLAKLMWTVPETAFMCRVSVRTLWRMAGDPDSRFPRARRLRGRTLFVRDEVLAFLAKGGNAR